MEEIIEILEKASNVLGNYWFSEVDSSYNNDDVIELNGEIDKLLNKLKGDSNG